MMKSLISTLAVLALSTSSITSGIITTNVTQKAQNLKQVSTPVPPNYKYKFYSNQSLGARVHSPNIFPLQQGNYVIYIYETQQNDYLAVGKLQADGTYKYNKQTVPAAFVGRDDIISASATNDMSKIVLGTNGGQWLCTLQADGTYAINKIPNPTGINPKSYISAGVHITPDGKHIYLLYNGYDTPLADNWGGLAVGTLQANNTYQYTVYSPKQIGTTNDSFSSLSVSATGEVVVTTTIDPYNHINGGLYIGTPDPTGHLTFTKAAISSQISSSDLIFSSIATNNSMITAFDVTKNVIVYGIKGEGFTYQFTSQNDPQISWPVAMLSALDGANPIIISIDKWGVNTGIYNPQTNKFIFGPYHQFCKKGTFNFVTHANVAKNANHVYISETNGVNFGTKQS